MDRTATSVLVPERAAARTGVRRFTPAQIFFNGVLIILVIVDLLPFIWMFLDSFKTLQDLTNNLWLPHPWTLANFQEIVTRANFARALLNSILVAVPRVILALIMSAALGYIFAKYHFPGRDVLFAILLATMMVPFVVLLIPLYVTLSDFHLVNKLSALVVVAAFSTVGTFILRQSIHSIPDDLLDAARMDGASEFWIYARLILPLSSAPLAALAVFTFLFSWDDYLFPSIVLTDPTIQTLPLVLAGLRNIFWSRYELFSAGAMLTVAPVMLLYSFMQKQFIRGITLTGMK